MTAHEFNFDALVGPTHNYAGLSYGNVASMSNKDSASNPKQAALQGLAKMKFVHDLGIRQAVLPPHERPHMPTLRRLGYRGSDADILARVAKDDPPLLAAVSSSSAMWAANAATVSPSSDTADGRVHFTPANLVANFHRAIEPQTTSRILRAIFTDDKHFAHHDPMPPNGAFSDEGAANHMRLCRAHGERGVEVFVFGKSAREPGGATPLKFPSRQSLEASQAVARLHDLECMQLFMRQSSTAIDAGAFHNDVVAVADRHVWFHHEQAVYSSSETADHIRRALPELEQIIVPANRVSLADAIKSYLFNSQLVSMPEGATSLIAPIECREIESVRQYLDELLTLGTSIKSIHYVDVRQSMRNGGGPACLRLRVVLTDDELAATNQGILFTPALHDRLRQWIDRHYRDHLAALDLADPKLLRESRAALEELTQVLALGSIYEFQC